MAMHLMNIPRNFDVVLTENLFGTSSPTRPPSHRLARMLPSATIGGTVNLYEPSTGRHRYCGTARPTRSARS